MRHPMYHKQPSMGDRVLQGAETVGKIYAAGKTAFEIGRAIGTVARYATPLLALA